MWKARFNWVFIFPEKKRESKEYLQGSDSDDGSWNVHWVREVRI